MGATGEEIRRQERTVRQDGDCQGPNWWPLLLTEGLRQSALGACSGDSALTELKLRRQQSQLLFSRLCWIRGLPDGGGGGGNCSWRAYVHFFLPLYQTTTYRVAQNNTFVTL